MHPTLKNYVGVYNMTDALFANLLTAQTKISNNDSCVCVNAYYLSYAIHDHPCEPLKVIRKSFQFLP